VLQIVSFFFKFVPCCVVRFGVFVGRGGESR